MAASKAGGPCGPLHATGTGLPPTDGGCCAGTGPGRHDFYFYQGDDERRTIKWQNSDGTPVADLTDADVLMQIRRQDADLDTTVICQVSTDVGDGVELTVPDEATFEFVFTKEKTLLLTGSEPFVYDLQVTPKAGDTKTILRGFVYFDLERSRAI
jgi:hypothetical protein